MNNKQRKFVRHQVKAMDEDILSKLAGDGGPTNYLEEMGKALTKWRTLADPVHYAFAARDVYHVIIDANAILFGELAGSAGATFDDVTIRKSEHLPAGYIMIHTRANIHIINLAAVDKQISIARAGILKGRF